MKRFALLICLVPSPALVQVYEGDALVIDGDTLELGSVRIRLFAIDAPELGQTCLRDEVQWRCGDEARAILAAFVDGKRLTCEERHRDQWNRVVARCEADGLDLSEAMVRGGLAIALADFSSDYVAAETRARSVGFNIWGSDFVTPPQHRAANPERFRPPPATENTKAAPDRPRRGGVYYRNCAAARAAGRAPIYRGQPGYRSGLDGDNDGVACEPYRRR